MANLPIDDTDTSKSEGGQVSNGLGAAGSSSEMQGVAHSAMDLLYVAISAMICADTCDAVIAAAEGTGAIGRCVTGLAVYSCDTKSRFLRLLCSSSVDGYRFPDAVPEWSDLLTVSSGRAIHLDVRPDETQLSLFCESPIVSFFPVYQNSRVVGAVGARYLQELSNYSMLLVAGTAAALRGIWASESSAHSWDTLRLLDAVASDDEEAELTDEQLLYATLTVREREVLQLMLEGISNKEIANKLFISPITCNHHVANILAKLHVHSRTAAVAVGMRCVQAKPKAKAQSTSNVVDWSKNLSRYMDGCVCIWDTHTGKLEFQGDMGSISKCGMNELPRSINQWAGLIHPADKDRVVALMKDSLRSGKAFCSSYRVIAKNGRTRHWVHQGGCAVSGGGDSKWIGVVQDITDDLPVDQQSNQATESMLVADTKGNVILVNQAARHQLGFGESASVDVCFDAIRLFVQESRPENPASSMNYKVQAASCTVRVNGSLRTVLCNISPLYDSHGIVYAILMVLLDDKKGPPS